MDVIELKIASQKKRIAIGWQPGLHSGWSVFGLNLILELSRYDDRAPLPIQSFNLSDFSQPLYRRLLSPSWQSQQDLQRYIDRFPGAKFRFDVPVLHALGHSMQSTLAHIRGQPNIGVVFSENTAFDEQTRASSGHFDRLIAGSTWNAQVLRANGMDETVAIFQGVDPELFHPEPRVRWMSDRFVIFAGGKLEYRKGQDIVVAAFKAFRSRHPSAFLLSAWQNHWPQFLEGMDGTGHVAGLPQKDGNKGLLLQPWLERNGIGPEDSFDVGFVPNHVMPQVLRACDAAVFTNRGEGGTNLVAMECLACGLPTILSANTGHLDLISSEHCYALTDQRRVRSTPLFPGVEGWGESSVEEVVAALERIYQDREQAVARGRQAARFMRDWSWQKQCARLLASIDAVSG